MPQFSFLFVCVFNVSCLVVLELPEFVVWCLTLIWENSQSLLFWIFFLFSFLFFGNSHYTNVTHFVVAPQFLNILVWWYFFFSVFLFVFRLWRFLLRYPQAQRFFFSCAYSNKSFKVILHYYYSMLSSLIFFSFFLRTSISPYVTNLFLHAVYFIH